MRRAVPLVMVTVVAFVLYALTLHPGVGGEINIGDSSKFQFIGVLLGVSHPPGNPLYLWFDALFSRLPIAHAISTRINLLSAIFGALTVGFVHQAIRQHASALAAATGALALALGPMFWIFSTEAEVYTLNTCLFAGSIWGMSAFCRRRSLRALDAAIFFFVLAFANHLTIVAAMPAWLWFFARASSRPRLLRRQLRGRIAVATVAAFVTLLAYAYIPWRVHAHASFSEFEGDLTWANFFRYVTAQKYRENVVHISVSVILNERLPEFWRYLAKQWLWPTLLVAPLGAAVIARLNRKLSDFVFIALLGFFAFAFLYAIPDADGFFMPVVTLIALFIGFAVDISRNVAARAVVLALVVAPLWLTALRHVVVWKRIVPFDRVVSIEATPDALWDISDVLDKVPDGATILAPCQNYGCVQVLNYYRFTDRRVTERHLKFAHFSDLGTDWGTVLDQIEPNFAFANVVCSLRRDDAEKMRRTLVDVRETMRDGHRIGARYYDGVSIFCSVPRPQFVRHKL